MCSATGRGTNRDEKDFYATPKESFAPLLEYLPKDVLFHEPCAGDGRLIRWLRESGRDAWGKDLFPQPNDIMTYSATPTNYLEDFSQQQFVITNPPFSVAFEMAQHARKHSKEFMFLLRLSFLESDERSEWLTANEPSALFVLKKRPSFVMSITCKSTIKSPHADRVGQICKHNWLLPIESERPKACPKCGGSKLAISTSDNSGYAWYYWGDRFKGIFHI